MLRKKLKKIIIFLIQELISLKLLVKILNFKSKAFYYRVCHSLLKNSTTDFPMLYFFRKLMNISIIHIYKILDYNQ